MKFMIMIQCTRGSLIDSASRKFLSSLLHLAQKRRLLTSSFFWLSRSSTIALRPLDFGFWWLRRNSWNLVGGFLLIVLSLMSLADLGELGIRAAEDSPVMNLSFLATSDFWLNSLF